MIIGRYPVLKSNFQRISTNRLVVDSPRFWRAEFHPRFKDEFTYTEFEEILLNVNEHMSFGLNEGFLSAAAIKLYEWFSGYRFAIIPAKNPQGHSMFLSDLYFALLDILPRMTFKDFSLDEDDFNVVTNKAETGKNDTSKVAVGEHNKQNTVMGTKADILTNGETRQVSNATTENVDEETDQNTKTVQDNFQSPQNQGVKPTTQNIKHDGVDGIDIPNSASFTTNTANVNSGDSTKTKSNVSTQGQQAENTLQQNNDIRTSHDNASEIGATQDVENTVNKKDNYEESLFFDRAKKLQEYYDLSSESLWHELLSRLSSWILSVDIATAERNYVGCPLYD